jgi:hypothetical protein
VRLDLVQGIYAYLERFSRRSPPAALLHSKKTEAHGAAPNPVLELQGSSARRPLYRLELSTLTASLVLHLLWGSACSRVTTTAFSLPSVQHLKSYPSDASSYIHQFVQSHRLGSSSKFHCSQCFELYITTTVLSTWPRLLDSV